MKRILAAVLLLMAFTAPAFAVKHEKQKKPDYVATKKPNYVIKQHHKHKLSSLFSRHSSPQSEKPANLGKEAIHPASQSKDAFQPASRSKEAIHPQRNKAK